MVIHNWNQWEYLKVSSKEMADNNRHLTKIKQSINNNNNVQWKSPSFLDDWWLYVTSFKLKLTD